MALALRISASIPPAAVARMLALIAEASDDPGRDGNGREAFAFIKSDPGDVSLKTCEEEAAKLACSVISGGYPPGQFADVAPKVLAAWRARAAMRTPATCVSTRTRSSSRCWPPCCTADSGDR